ncbi:nuclease-related domain-containing protein [Oceanobacillus sp. CAU 1775]
MIYKPRTKPTEWIPLNYLRKRMTLDSTLSKQYSSLTKGYAGETVFDTFLEKLSHEHLVLNDLLFEVNSTTFQIDTLIITQDKLHIFEVKNFEGDYIYESSTDKLFRRPRFEVINPLHQLNRTESLLQQLLRTQGIKLQINSYVVFINPSFVLYQAPIEKPIIFRNQLDRFIENLNSAPGKIMQHHKRIADRLVGLHVSESIYTRVPEYSFEELRKGIPCLECDSFSGVVGRMYYVCKECSFSEPVDAAVLRCVEEFKVLFPESKVTTRNIYEWCAVLRERRIREILLRNFLKKDNNRMTYFE